MPLGLTRALIYNNNRWLENIQHNYVSYSFVGVFRVN